MYPTRENTSVCEDVNDLEEAFGYYRPILEEQEASAAPGEAPRRRGRPPKDPSAAMSDVQKADRRATLIMLCEKQQASKVTP